MHPYVKTAENIQTFIGDLSNADLLKDCLRNADVIFNAVAQNSNEPGCSIAQRTAHGIVSALGALREVEGSDFKCPILVFLSSSSLNPVFTKGKPRPLLWVLHRGAFYVYEDLKKAIKYLEEQPWVPLIIAEPPALVKDVSRGHELSLEKLEMAISYDDLARGMVQMAEEEDGHKWVGKRVGITATGKVKMDFLRLGWYLSAGMVSYYSPAAWKILQKAGLNP